MGKCLVTGGAGFIGSHIVEALLQRGHEVTVLDNYSLGTDENLAEVAKDLEIVKGDVRDMDLIVRLTAGKDYIFHEAAASSTLMFIQDLRGAMSTNIEGFMNVLSAALTNGCKRVIYASSSTVYGNITPPLQEDLKPLPGNFYAASKLCDELLAAAFSKVHELETVGLRYMGVYGPREAAKGNAASVVTQFLLWMRDGKKPIVYNDGTQTRDFTYVKDVARANILACECPGRLLAEVLNVGAGIETTMNQLVAALNKVLRSNTTPDYIPVPYAGYQIRQLADITRINKVLGYSPQCSLEDGIRAIVETTGISSLARMGGDSQKA